MDVTVNQKRRTARQSGITLSPGQTYASLPIIGINRDVHDDFAIFARRLTSALFYKHLGKVLPPAHMIKTQWMQFAHGKAEEIVGAITRDMPHLAQTGRVNTNIGQQFSYRWYADEETETFVFMAQFAMAFFVIGLASPSNEATVGDGWKSHANDLLSS
ncbi:hypothetical protein [Agrobacterium tumefaciens]|uniref:hypothetical protein n=1 Tax=Agrobacterium tumefaciens TaxID=358 RepID=UPI0012D30AAA|nr:hypothetical protein [Agrobacterium tumefaciens]